MSKVMRSVYLCPVVVCVVFVVAKLRENFEI